MIEIEKIMVAGLEVALRGMRNPLQSWDKSDSFYGCSNGSNIAEKFTKCENCHYECNCNDRLHIFKIGEKDLKLAQNLIAAGTDHSKFMRQIYVGMDITAPLYWWKEFDTYKVGTVANSESTMHTISNNPITLNNFSFDGGIINNPDWVNDLITIVHLCETYRKKFLEAKEKNQNEEAQSYWRRLIQILPNAWNQKRTVTLNYANLRNIYFARKNHKLQEWHDFCKFIELLPYGKDLICYKG